MNTPHSDPVLIVDLELRLAISWHLPFKRLNCPIVVATSLQQALNYAYHVHPCLVLLMGEHIHWPKSFIHQVRAASGLAHLTILAVADSDASSWIHREENPGLDGFLVNPLSTDVLTSLIESASAKQVCHCHAV